MSQARFTTSDPRHSSLRMWAGAIHHCSGLSSALLALQQLLLQKPYCWPVPVNLDAINLPPLTLEHFLGTDLLGRDILAEAL